MTTVLFGLSAVFPGETPGESWDASWTPLSTGIVEWSDNIAVADNNGNPLSGLMALSTTFGTNNDSGVVPTDTTPNQYEEYGLNGISFGNEIVWSAVIDDSFVSMPNFGNAVSEQDITLYLPWNTIKDIEVSDLSSNNLKVTGFVDTWVNAPTDNEAHTITIDEAKRGAVSLGNGDDTVAVNVAANEYTWSSQFDISTGDGNDTVSVQPEAYSVLASLSAPAGWTFNSAPQLTTADITVGNGNDTVELSEVSGTVHVGSGNDTIDLTDGNSTVWLGSGNDTVMIGSSSPATPPTWAVDKQAGTSTVHVGTGHADIIIDDSTPTLTPQTTLEFIRGETGGSMLATADVVQYGHVDQVDPVKGFFVGGDMTALTIDLAGYSPGSTTTLTAAPGGAPMLLQIHDAATGSTDAIALYGNVPANPASLNLRFV